MYLAATLLVVYVCSLQSSETVHAKTLCLRGSFTFEKKTVNCSNNERERILVLSVTYGYLDINQSTSNCQENMTVSCSLTFGDTNTSCSHNGTSMNMNMTSVFLVEYSCISENVTSDICGFKWASTIEGEQFSVTIIRITSSTEQISAFPPLVNITWFQIQINDSTECQKLNPLWIYIYAGAGNSLKVSCGADYPTNNTIHCTNKTATPSYTGTSQSVTSPSTPVSTGQPQVNNVSTTVNSTSTLLPTTSTSDAGEEISAFTVNITWFQIQINDSTECQKLNSMWIYIYAGAGNSLKVSCGADYPTNNTNHCTNKTATPSYTGTSQSSTPVSTNLQPQENNESATVGVVVAVSVVILIVIPLAMFIYCRQKKRKKANNDEDTIQNGDQTIGYHQLGVTSQTVDHNRYCRIVEEPTILRRPSTETSRGKGSISLSVISTESAVVYSDVNSADDDGDITADMVTSRVMVSPIPETVQEEGANLSTQTGQVNGNTVVISMPAEDIYSDVNSTEISADCDVGLTRCHVVSGIRLDEETMDEDIGYMPINLQLLDQKSDSERKQSIEKEEYYQEIEGGVVVDDSRLTSTLVNRDDDDDDLGYQPVNMGNGGNLVKQTDEKDEIYQSVDDPLEVKYSVGNLEDDFYESVDRETEAPSDATGVTLYNSASTDHEHYEVVDMNIQEQEVTNTHTNMSTTKSENERIGEVLPLCSVVNKRKTEETSTSEPSSSREKTAEEDCYNLQNLKQDKPFSGTEGGRKSEIAPIYGVVNKRKGTSGHATEQRSNGAGAKDESGNTSDQEMVNSTASTVNGDYCSLTHNTEQERNCDEDVFADHQESFRNQESEPEEDDEYDHLRVRTLSHGHKSTKHEQLDTHDHYYNHLNV